MISLALDFKQLVCSLLSPCLLMACMFGLNGQPIHSYTKIVDKSIYPASIANEESRIGFYEKFHVGIHITGVRFYDCV